MDVPGSNESVKVLLDVSCVSLPLSGIGRYTLELARNLPLQDCISELCFLRGDRVVAAFDADFGEIDLVKAHGSSRTALKAVLPGSIMKPLRAWKAARLDRQLESYQDYVFHSPNFHLPQVSGRSVVTVHDLSVFHYPEFHPCDRVSFLQDAIQSSVERADLLLTDSEFVRSELIEQFGLEPERVLAIGLGVDERYAPAPDDVLLPKLRKYGLLPNGYVLNVGTIEPRKNIQGLLQIYSQLDPSLRRQYPLVLVGAYGWNSTALMKEIKILQATGELIYLEYVPEKILPAIYAGAAAYCCTSFYEGFGLPLLEAMSSAVPIVCSNTSSMPEVCAQAGLLVDPHDEPAMTRALERSLIDDQWRERAVSQGLQQSKAYRWKTTAAKTAHAYCRLGS